MCHTYSLLVKARDACVKQENQDLRVQHGKKDRTIKRSIRQNGRGVRFIARGSLYNASQSVAAEKGFAQGWGRSFRCCLWQWISVVRAFKKGESTAFGMDISDNMISIAAKRYPHCTFSVQPCIPLDFENNSMNVITVSCAFHHFENPQKFAEECMRVLKDGGKIYMAEPNFSSFIRWMANAIVFPFSHTGDVRGYSSKELCRFFKKAGFKDMQVYTKQTVLFFSAKK